MTIVVPSVIDLSSAERVIGSLDTNPGEVMSISFDNSAESNIHPSILCAIAATAFSTQAAGGEVELTPNAPVPELVRRMGLTQALGLPDGSLPYLPDATGRYIPVQRVRNNGEISALVTDFVPLLHAEPVTARAVSYVLHELLRNVIEHSGSASGAFVAADLDAGGCVRVGVADSGIGVPRSIRRSHTAHSDRDALGLALQPGVSGTTSRFGGNETNGGAGLFFMRSMCAVSGQSLVLASGGSFVRMESRQTLPLDLSEALESAEMTWLDLANQHSGTVVGVDLHLGPSGGYDELFGQIRGVYHSRVRDRKKAARKARFT